MENSTKPTSVTPEISFASDLPYPMVCISEKNFSYAKAMLDNIGGSTSEMSAVSLYLYNNLITGAYENIPFIYHKISIVEMHHLEIFGQLSYLLGENPRLWSQGGRQKKYWTPAYNRYPTTLKELLINSIREETAAIQKYTYQTHHIQDTKIVEILKRIILDEEIHVTIFRRLYEENC